jgi:hypothetical protein
MYVSALTKEIIWGAMQMSHGHKRLADLTQLLEEAKALVEIARRYS